MLKRNWIVALALASSAALLAAAPPAPPASVPATAKYAGPVPTTAPADAKPPEAITPKEKTDLFNGKDFTGWVADAKTAAVSDWTIKDGMIECVGKPNGYLRTTAAYTQYKVTVEWRFTKAGNTGVCVHMNPPPATTTRPNAVWPMCIECQGMHGHQGDFWIWSGAHVNEPLKQTNGVIMTTPSAEKPVGEWNTFQVICKDDTVTIIVNGTTMNKVTGSNIKEGWIGLQSEGAGIEVRKVYIEPLEP